MYPIHSTSRISRASIAIGRQTASGTTWARLTGAANQQSNEIPGLLTDQLERMSSGGETEEDRKDAGSRGRELIAESRRRACRRRSRSLPLDLHGPTFYQEYLLSTTLEERVVASILETATMLTKCSRDNGSLNIWRAPFACSYVMALRKGYLATSAFGL